MNNANRAKIIRLLSEAVDMLIEAVGSGRLGFDYAIKEYVDKYNNELSRALREYVQTLKMGNETQRYPSEEEEARLMEVRREALNKIAKDFNVPEVTAFVAAVLESQDKQLSILKTLEGQAEQLHQALSKG
jgi:tight adherence protein C